MVKNFNMELKVKTLRGLQVILKMAKLGKRVSWTPKTTFRLR
jgi:hypothetical protein